MVFIEFSVSHGPGTLIEHGAKGLSAGAFILGAEIRDPHHMEVRFQEYEITAERYQEFISIHGGERAV